MRHRNGDGLDPSSTIYRQLTAARGVRPLALVGRKSPVLHEVAEPVLHIDEDTVGLALRMCATLGRHPGVALAAPQIGRSLRLVVTESLAIANPRIISVLDERTESDTEGCLSIPGRWYVVQRPTELEIAGIDVATGAPWRAMVSGFQARMWSHEIDHLDGHLISDGRSEVRYGIRD